MLAEGFRRIRTQMRFPEAFPSETLAEADRAAAIEPSEGKRKTSRLEIEFVTIDPPGSRDLDQAWHGERITNGYLIHYAIADLGHFIRPGGALDREAVRRGKTFYCPDLRLPLYPPALSEGAASLLPGQNRPAVLWTFELDLSGRVRHTSVEQAIVSSRRQMTYDEAQTEIDAGKGGPLEVLSEVGPLRRKLEAERGGVDLHLPEQEVHKTETGFELRYRTELAVESWNAQISLMTGMAAAKIMMAARLGLLRTLPPPDAETIQRLRLSAQGLGLTWPQDQPYQEFTRHLDPGKPRQAAFLSLARVLFQGAGYTLLDGTIPAQTMHSSIAAPYAHVTAPLRRMADRLVNELALSLAVAEKPASWLLNELRAAPDVMHKADHLQRELESRIVDFIEAAMLEDSVGQIFEAVVVESGAKGGVVQLADPAVLGPCRGAGLPLGKRMMVKLVEADPRSGRVSFVPAEVAGPGS
jgi:exoribonuclease R